MGVLQENGTIKVPWNVCMWYILARIELNWELVFSHFNEYDVLTTKEEHHDAFKGKILA